MIRSAEQPAIGQWAPPGTRILVHHHAVAHAEGDMIHVQSFLGSWVAELANRYERVGLLLPTTRERRPRQDVSISQENVTLHSLGAAAGSGRLSRNRRIRRICQELDGQYDQLLIRGITPRQLLVYRSCRARRKAFLLVGSIVDSRPRLQLSAQSAFDRLMYHYRVAQLRSIARDATVLANSPRVARELAEVLGVEAAFVPTNTIAHRHFAPFAVRPVNGSPQLLFCGRVVPEKGIEELIVAGGLLRQRGVACTIRVIGDAAPAYRAHLERLAGREGVSARLKFEGFVPFGERLLRYYQEADCHVLPSWHEGFPHSIWEAAASCTPVITTAAGGIPGLVSEREVTFVPVRSPAAIADGVERLIQDPDRRAAMVRSAYDRARCFTVERCAELLSDALNDQRSTRKDACTIHG